MTQSRFFLVPRGRLLYSSQHSCSNEPTKIPPSQQHVVTMTSQREITRKQHDRKSKYTAKNEQMRLKPHEDDNHRSNPTDSHDHRSFSNEGGRSSPTPKPTGVREYLQPWIEPRGRPEALLLSIDTRAHWFRPSTTRWTQNSRTGSCQTALPDCYQRKRREENRREGCRW